MTDFFNNYYISFHTELYTIIYVQKWEHNTISSGIQFFLGNENGQFQNITNHFKNNLISSDIDFAKILFGDWDHDGKDELLCNSVEAHQWNIIDYDNEDLQFPSFNPLYSIPNLTSLLVSKAT